MKVAIIGQGAIAHYVRSKLAELGIAEVAQIVRVGKEVDATDTLLPRISHLRHLPKMPDLIVDCGGHPALAMHGPVALAMGLDVLTVSVGALADASLAEALHTAAETGNARLHLSSGAIGGLDALRGARVGQISAVTYIGRKPPLGWQGSPAQDKLDLATLTTAKTHFMGSAREAALAYPKNANVAAAVALAGIGFDRTQVSLIADPAITTNTHEICAVGDFGELNFTIAGHGLHDNPRSSALAAMSIVADLAERRKWIGF